MNNGISFRFNFETDNYDMAHEVMPKILERVKALQQLNTGYRSVELSLLKPGQDKKTACLTIHTHDSVIREESRENDWEHAIDMVFSHIESTSQHTIKID